MISDGIVDAPWKSGGSSLHKSLASLGRGKMSTAFQPIRLSNGEKRKSGQQELPTWCASPSCFAMGWG